MKWMPPEMAAEFASAGTDAYRIAGGREGRVERYGSGAIISHQSPGAAERLLPQLTDWQRQAGVALAAIYERQLVIAPGSDDTPRQLAGKAIRETTALEAGLRYSIDFLAGYSCGLFLDQRANRAHLRQLAPRRMLNTFAYTCSFSVVAAAAGAETLSIDVARLSLNRGRDNFSLNNLPTDGHRFIADDVLEVLPRLARRGEKFDAIVLDPPTFSRSKSGRVFRVQKDFPRLLELALACAAPGAWILLSTNCTGLGTAELRDLAAKVCGGWPRFYTEPLPPDLATGKAASTVWLRA